jgi:hypothetical protein
MLGEFRKADIRSCRKTSNTCAHSCGSEELVVANVGNIAGLHGVGGETLTFGGRLMEAGPSACVAGAGAVGFLVRQRNV